MHFHGVDLHDLFAGRMSFRRLSVLVNRLMVMYGKSALSEALLGEPAHWSNEEYMLADVIDRLEIGNWLMTEVHKSEDTSNPVPKPYPRPGMSAESESLNELTTNEPEMASAHELAQWFAQISS